MEKAALKLFHAKGPLPDVSHPVMGRTVLQAQYVLSKILAKKLPSQLKQQFPWLAAFKRVSTTLAPKEKVDIQVTMIIMSLAKVFFFNRVADTQVQFMILDGSYVHYRIS